MLWSTEPFLKAHAALKNAGQDLEAIEAALSPITEDLRSLLKIPPKSEAHRAKLGSKKLEIDGEVLNLNDAFINDAARVSEELSLDELVAAKLIFYAAADSRRLGVAAYESAITMFYVRRLLIIDIARYCTETLPLSAFGLVYPARTTLKSKSLMLHIVDALKTVERSMEGLDEKVKASEFMGVSDSPDFRQLLKIQRSFLIKEHECLGNLLTSYMAANGSAEYDVAIFQEVMAHLSSFSVFDSRILAYFPAVVTWISATEPSVQFTNAAWKYFSATAAAAGTSSSSASSSSSWKLQYWQAGLSLVFFTFMAIEDRALPESVDFLGLVAAVKRSIDKGALEFWMSLILDIKLGQGDLHFEKYTPLMRNRVPQIISWQPTVSQATVETLQSAFETLCIEFIANLADVLKEMRLSEEDMYLAANEGYNENVQISPGVDLERFFLVVAATYRDAGSASRVFFDDEGNALYGFLIWGADCQVTFIAAVYAEMLACLANDAATSKNVHEFLLSMDMKAAKGEGVFVLSWKYIYTLINEYLRSVSISQTNLSATGAAGGAANAGTLPSSGISLNSMSASNVLALPSLQDLSNGSDVSAIPTRVAELPRYGQRGDIGEQQNLQVMGIPPPPMEITEDTLLIMAAYMHLVSQVASYNEQARDFLRGNSNGVNASIKDITPLLFKLLKLQQPIASAIFIALASLISADMWPSLDNLMLGQFDIVLTSSSDVLAFIELVTKLVGLDPKPEPCRIQPYVDFILEHVFTWSADEKTLQHPSQKIMASEVQLKCLNFLKTILDTNVLSQTNGPGQTSVGCQTSGLSELALKACFKSKVYSAIFSAFRIGLDELNQFSEDHLQVKITTISVEVCSTLLLKSGNPPSFLFDKPILYNLHIVPSIAMYAGSRFPGLSHASLILLSHLDNSPEFKPTISRQSRILSILSSSSEASKIRVGLISRLGDIDTPSANKQVLLEMLLGELKHSSMPKQYMSVAHYLLGFVQSELGLQLKLELDTGVGGIATGTSLLKVVCDILIYCLNNLVSASSVTILRLCSSIIGYLAKDPLTSKLLLDYLRPSDFWLNTIILEPLSIPSVNIEDFYEHRAIILEIWKLEIQMCQQQLLLTIENHYLDALVPIVFVLFDFTNVSPHSSIALRCLQAWCNLIPVLLDTGNPKTGVTFVSRAIETVVTRLPQYARQNTEFASPVAALLVRLFEKYQENGVDYSLVRTSLYIFQAALQSVQPSLLHETLRSDLYTLCVQYLRISLNSEYKEIESLTLKELENSGFNVLHVACDDVFNTLDETLRVNALKFLQISAKLSCNLGSNFVVDTFIRSNFIAVLIQQCIKPALDERNNKTISKQAAEVASASQLVILSLSLLVPVAQTRNGALEIVRAELVNIADKYLDKLREDVLLLVLETLTAMLISLGPDYGELVTPVRKLIYTHQDTIEDMFDREASLNNALGQTSDIQRIVKCFTVLISLSKPDNMPHNGVQT